MVKTDTGDASEIVILVNGKRVLTVPQAAARHGVGPSTMRGTITREKIPYVHKLDGRTPLYDPDVLDAALAARPGPGRRKGANRRAAEAGPHQQVRMP